MKPSEIEPATLRLLAEYLNQLRHQQRAPDPISNRTNLRITTYELSDVYRLCWNLSQGTFQQEENK
jgi:hypothetical protein